MFFRSRPALRRHASRLASQPSSRSRKLRLEPLEDRQLLNAAPTDIALPLSTVLEQQPPGTPVGMFTTTDPDLVNDFTYTLVPGAGSTDNASFTIDAQGDLLTTSTFDFQTQPTCSIRVRSTDQGGLWLEKAFTVTVEQFVGRRVDLVSTALLSASGNSDSDRPSISSDGRYVAFGSSASNLVSGDINGAPDVFVRDLTSGVTTCVSTDSSAVQGNQTSWDASISDDGRYVSFSSYASNLVSGDTNASPDFFVKDLVSGTTTRVCTYSSGATISDDGRYAVFSSTASDLVPGDTNKRSDIFINDLVSGITTRVSTDSSGIQGNEASETPSISADGRYVAFRSWANNLVPRDTNESADIFVKDLVSGWIRLLGFSGEQLSSSISGDGRYVAFQSRNGQSLLYDIFVKDLVSQSVSLVSADSAGLNANDNCWDPRISDDGRYVAFWSDATNLVSDDTNESFDIFVKDVVSGVTTRVSVGNSADQSNSSSGDPRSYIAPSISGDGRYVAFCSYASNLVSNDNNGAYDIFVKDLTAGTIRLASARNAATSPASGGSGESVVPSISDDGRYVVFSSNAGNIVSGDASGAYNVFVKDLTSGKTTLVSTVGSTIQGNGGPDISDDGRYVTFSSLGSNLVPEDTNGKYDIFVKDLASGEVTRVSTGSSGVQGNGYSFSPNISGDGRYVAFFSHASNLVPGDTNGSSDIFLRDLLSMGITRVSTDSSGVQGNDDSAANYSSTTAPSISDDGRYVAFCSSASNLVIGDTNGCVDIFVKDMVSGVTARMSTGVSAAEGNGDSIDASISGDGRFVAFRSYASNLVLGDTNGYVDIFVKDMVSGVITRVSTDSSGGQCNDSSAAQWEEQTPSLSDDGRYVAFSSSASNLVSGDTNGCADIFTKDMVSGVTTRVSTDRSGGQGDGWSFASSISGDGQYVAFGSDARNLHAWDSTRTLDVFRVANALPNYPPTKVLLMGSSVSEDTRSGTLVGTLSTDDLDAADTFAYTLLDSAGGRFKLVGNQVQVADGTRLDFETATSHTIRVQTTDQGGAGFSYEQDLVVSITDVHDFASPALFDPATSLFQLRCSNTSGDADYTFGYDGGSVRGAATLIALVGDWDGDGQTGVGLYSPRTSMFYLGNAYQSGFAEYTFGYGEPGGGLIPLVGDWDGDGRTGVGLYNPQASTFYLTDSLESGYAQYTFGYGEPGGGWTPLVGDWNGDGHTGVGLYNPQASTFYLTDTLQSGYAERTFGYGEPGGGWTPLVGDWNGDRADGVGLFAPQSSTFYLTNAFTSGYAEYTFGYGEPNAGWKPLVADWNGNGAAGVGLYAPSSSTFYLTDTLQSGYAEYTVDFGTPNAGWQPLVGCWGASPSVAAPSAKAVDQIDLADVAAESASSTALIGLDVPLLDCSSTNNASARATDLALAGL
jgi:Tol biopolymer transport system component